MADDCLFFVEDCLCFEVEIFLLDFSLEFDLDFDLDFEFALDLDFDFYFDVDLVLSSEWC